MAEYAEIAEAGWPGKNGRIRRKKEKYLSGKVFRTQIRSALSEKYGAGLNIRNRNFGKSLSFLNIDSNFKKFSAQAILPRGSQIIS